MAVQAGLAIQEDKKSGQTSLFGDFDDASESADEVAAAAVPAIDEWPDREKLVNEKEVLGYYIDSHPLAEFDDKLASFRTKTIDQLGDLKDRDEVTLGGMISSIKLANTKNPKPGQPSKYANFDLEDMGGAIRCILWPRGFVDHGDHVQPDAVVVAKGKIDRRGGGDEANLIIDELIPYEGLTAKYTHGLRIRLDGAHDNQNTVKQLREILRGYPGKQDLRFSVDLGGGDVVYLKPETSKINVNDDLRKRIDDCLGTGRYKLLMSRPK